MAAGTEAGLAVPSSLWRRTHVPGLSAKSITRPARGCACPSEASWGTQRPPWAVSPGQRTLPCAAPSLFFYLGSMSCWGTTRRPSLGIPRLCGRGIPPL